MILPVSHERTTVGRWPVVVFGVMGICLAAFFLPWLSGDGAGLLHALGLVPAEPDPLSLVTYAFVHASLAHLFFNLLFFYLTAPFVEDAWGSLPFGLFYLAAAVTTGLLHALRYPESAVPLVGASGAIAACMGTFLVLFGRTKVDFVYWLGFAGGTFSAPAYLMLPLWLGSELLAARLGDRAGTAGAAGVAYWVHVWGFLLGVVVALAVRLTGGEKEATVPDDPGDLLRTALKAQATGRPAEAWRILERALRLDPGDEVRRDAFWSLSRELGQEQRAAPIILADVRNALRTGPPTHALDRWQLLHQAIPELPLEPGLLLRLSEVAERCHRPSQAEDLLKLTVKALDSETPAETLMRALRRTEDSPLPLRRKVVQVALANPQLPPGLRRDLERERSRW